MALPTEVPRDVYPLLWFLPSSPSQSAQEMCYSVYRQHKFLNQTGLDDSMRTG